MFSLFWRVFMHLFYGTPGSCIGLDADVDWMLMFVGVLNLICDLRMRLLHCWGGSRGGGVGVATNVRCLLHQ